MARFEAYRAIIAPLVHGNRATAERSLTNVEEAIRAEVDGLNLTQLPMSLLQYRIVKASKR